MKPLASNFYYRLAFFHFVRKKGSYPLAYHRLCVSSSPHFLIFENSILYKIHINFQFMRDRSKIIYFNFVSLIENSWRSFEIVR